MVAEESSTHLLGGYLNDQVDCTQISDLCQVNNISEYPTRRPYVRGEFHSNYKLDRTVIAFTHYLNIIEEDVDKKKYDEVGEDNKEDKDS